MVTAAQEDSLLLDPMQKMIASKGQRQDAPSRLSCILELCEMNCPQSSWQPPRVLDLKEVLRFHGVQVPSWCLV